MLFEQERWTIFGEHSGGSLEFRDRNIGKLNEDEAHITNFTCCPKLAIQTNQKKSQTTFEPIATPDGLPNTSGSFEI